MSTYLITGASRGLGFALTSQLSQRSDVSLVIAASRSQPTEQLGSLIASSSGKVVHVLCDVTSQEGVDNAMGPITKAVGATGLDVLINNVGVCPSGLKCKLKRP